MMKYPGDPDIWITDESHFEASFRIFFADA